MDYNGGTSVSNNNQNLAHYNDQYSYDIEYKYKTNTRYQRYLVKKKKKEMDHVPNSVLDVGCGQGLNNMQMPITDQRKMFLLFVVMFPKCLMMMRNLI